MPELVVERGGWWIQKVQQWSQREGGTWVSASASQTVFETDLAS